MWLYVLVCSPRKLVKNFQFDEYVFSWMSWNYPTEDYHFTKQKMWDVCRGVVCRATAMGSSSIQSFPLLASSVGNATEKHLKSHTQEGNLVPIYEHTPRKLTWNLKITPLKGKIIFRTSILGFKMWVFGGICLQISNDWMIEVLCLNCSQVGKNHRRMVFHSLEEDLDIGWLNSMTHYLLMIIQSSKSLCEATSKPKTSIHLGFWGHPCIRHLRCIALE